MCNYCLYSCQNFSNPNRQFLQETNYLSKNDSSQNTQISLFFASEYHLNCTSPKYQILSNFDKTKFQEVFDLDYHISILLLHKPKNFYHRLSEYTHLTFGKTNIQNYNYLGNKSLSRFRNSNQNLQLRQQEHGVFQSEALSILPNKFHLFAICYLVSYEIRFQYFMQKA